MKFSKNTAVGIPNLLILK